MNIYKATGLSVTDKNSVPSRELSGADEPTASTPIVTKKRIRVLVVGGTAQLQPLSQYLKTRDYLVSEARNGTEVLKILQETVFDLIILDISLGFFDDWQLLKVIHGLSDAPIIGRVDLDNLTRVSEGLELGMNDYVSRSVDLAELDARIRVILLRSEQRRRRTPLTERRIGIDRRKMPLGRRKTDQQKVLFGDAIACLTAGPFKVNDHHKMVTVEGREQRLSPKEYNLLKLLVAVPGRVVSNEEIIASLWPHSSRATISDVQQYVHLLRVKVEKNPKQPRWIKTVKGFGYRLASEDEE